MDGDAKPSLARLLEEGRVVAVTEVRILAASHVDADNAAMPVSDRLLEDDRVQRLVEGPVQAKDEASLHWVLEERAVEPADRRHDDVVEIALASAISLHRVVAELERRDVCLPIGAADDVIDGLLHREGARLDKLGPVIQRQKILERLLGLLADRDEIDEFPVVLGRKTDPLVMRDPPHRRRVDRPAEMHV
jgi:hypothetical protein